MNTFLSTPDFDGWLRALKDKVERARVLHRIRSAELGDFSDCKAVGEGVRKMRIHTGPGYRVYYSRQSEVLYLLLIGGDKSSQQRDIRRAIELTKSLEQEKKL